MSKCLTCKKEMGTGRVEDEDCGGDCLECMGTAGDPAAAEAFIKEVRRLRAALQEIADFPRDHDVGAIARAALAPQKGEP